MPQTKGEAADVGEGPEGLGNRSCVACSCAML